MDIHGYPWILRATRCFVTLDIDEKRIRKQAVLRAQSQKLFAISQASYSMHVAFKGSPAIVAFLQTNSCFSLPSAFSAAISCSMYRYSQALFSNIRFLDSPQKHSAICVDIISFWKNLIHPEQLKSASIKIALS